MVSDADRLLTVKELSERLRVSLATAYELVKRGKIPSIRVGMHQGSIRIRQSDLAFYLAASTHQAVTEQSSHEPVRVQLKHIKLK